MAIWHRFAWDNMAWVKRSTSCYPCVPVHCCSSHFFLLLFCYLPFLVALLMRQLVDWLVNVCTTLWTCKVLIQCSLLPLLCFCLFSCFSDGGLRPQVFCDVIEHWWDHGWDFRIPSVIPPLLVCLSLTPSQGTCFLLCLTLVCCPTAVHHRLVHVNLKPMLHSSGISVRNLDLMCCRQHGALLGFL